MIFVGIVVIILIILLFLKNGKYIGKDEGEIGEMKVSEFLGETVENEKYVFNDYYIIDNKKTVQIDHILVNKAGIFVIETKNYSGSIYGSEEQREWTQVLGYGADKNKFYNPVKQNSSHVYHINKILRQSRNLKNVPIFSVVVFVKANIENVSANNVFNLYNFKDYINNQVRVLSVEDLLETVDLLNFNKANEYVSKEQHIENIKAMREKIENNICPRCGGKLVLRNGKYGDFYGCENYPRCKFIKKIDEKTTNFYQNYDDDDIY